MMEFVSWDDDIPNIWKVIKVMFQTTNQTVNTLPILDTLQKIKFSAG